MTHFLLLFQAPERTPADLAEDGVVQEEAPAPDEEDDSSGEDDGDDDDDGEEDAGGDDDDDEGGCLGLGCCSSCGSCLGGNDDLATSYELAPYAMAGESDPWRRTAVLGGMGGLLATMIVGGAVILVD